MNPNPNRIKITTMKTLSQILLTCLACGSLFAGGDDYINIDDFEDEPAGFFMNGLIGDKWVINSMWPEVTSGSIVEFPVGSGNQTFWGDLSIAVSSTSGNHTFASVALDPVIDPANPETSTAIVYFQYLQQGSDKVFNFFSSDVPVVLGDNPETVDVVEQVASAPITWGELEAIFFLDGLNQAGFRDAGNYYVSRDFVPENDVWYEFWVYMDSAATTYTVWQRESGSTEPPLLLKIYDGHRQNDASGWTGETYEEYFFRRGDGNPLTTIGWAYNALQGNDKWFVDDVYIRYAPEVDTTTLKPVASELVTPPGVQVPGDGGGEDETWFGYPVVELDGAKWVNTGEWLSWVNLSNVDASGSGWIFIQNIESFAYISASSATASGAWIYVLK
jgi:hypothetical protein